MLVYGTSASETLGGTADHDVILGLEGHDLLIGLGGNDTLLGGAGSDSLSGGTGADAFVVDMTVTVKQGGASSFSGWLLGLGVQVPPAGSITQGQFSSAYTMWLEHLVATYQLGVDVDGDGAIAVDINQNDPFGTPRIEGMTQAQLGAMFGERTAVDVITGNTMHTRYYSDTFLMGDVALVHGSGTDIVMDFNRAEGDKLAIAGITPAELASAQFNLVEADANGDAVLDTVITAVNDASFSITLLGHTGFNAAQDVMFL